MALMIQQNNNSESVGNSGVPQGVQTQGHRLTGALYLRSNVMAINLKVPEMKELRPRITVLGVGGAGGSAVNNMIESGLEGVDFVVANTDAHALAQSRCNRRIQLGTTTTEGLGAGAQPEVGRAGAEESLTEIMEQLSGSHM